MRYLPRPPLALSLLLCASSCSNEDPSTTDEAPACPESQGDGGSGGGRTTVLIIEPVTDAPCLARTITQDDAGRIPCLIVEASRLEAGQSACHDPGRKPLCSKSLATAAQELPEYAQEQWNSLCEVPQLAGAELNACLNDIEEPAVDGWCFIDPLGIGNPALVESCAPYEKRRIRFVGQGKPRSGAQFFIHCFDP